MSSTLPTRLGRYKVLGRLAAGGMAEILLAVSTGPGDIERPVVIKRILPHLAEDRGFGEMFLNEAQIVAGIRHPRVVQLIEFVADGELFLVLEYVEGENLGGLLRRMWSRGESLPYWLAAHIVAEACAGLHAAHELTAPDGSPRHVVHRDVSPQNVMVTYTGDVKVLDFGIAKARDRASRTEAGEVKGKVEYMSPEQCRGEPLDRRSDIFALGILLYELSVGRRLFRRDTMLSTFAAICDEPIPLPRETRPDYPDDLEAICRRALARRPMDRYRTANDMRRELVGVMRRLGGDDVAEDVLAGTLQRLFTDRIEEKREMLRRLRAGADLDAIPAADVDRGVEIPSVIATTTDANTRSGRRRTRAGLLVGGALAAGLVSVIAWNAVTRTRETSASREVPSQVVINTSAASSPSAAPSPAAPIRVAIETTPAGATVTVGGVARGVTPIAIELPRGNAPIELKLSSKGYVPRAEKIVPDADQKLLLTLERVKTVTPTKAPTKKSSPSAPPSIGRFD